VPSHHSSHGNCQWILTGGIPAPLKPFTTGILCFLHVLFLWHCGKILTWILCFWHAVAFAISRNLVSSKYGVFRRACQILCFAERWFFKPQLCRVCQKWSGNNFIAKNRRHHTCDCWVARVASLCAYLEFAFVRVSDSLCHKLLYICLFLSENWFSGCVWHISVSGVHSNQQFKILDVEGKMGNFLSPNSHAPDSEVFPHEMKHIIVSENSLNVATPVAT